MPLSLTVRIGDKKLRGSEVEQLEIRQEIGRHHDCDLVFFHREGKLRLDELLDAAVAVTLKDGDTTHTVFEGEVVEGSQTHLPNFVSAFQIRAASLSLRLERHRDTAYFPNSTLADLTRAFGGTFVGDKKGPPSAGEALAGKVSGVIRTPSDLLRGGADPALEQAEQLGEQAEALTDLSGSLAEQAKGVPFGGAAADLLRAGGGLAGGAKGAADAAAGAVRAPLDAVEEASDAAARAASDTIRAGEGAARDALSAAEDMASDALRPARGAVSEAAEVTENATGTTGWLAEQAERSPLGAGLAGGLRQAAGAAGGLGGLAEQAAGMLRAPTDALAGARAPLTPSKPAAPDFDRLNYVQHGETDFDFLRRVADDHGYMVRPMGRSVEVRKGFSETNWELRWGTHLLSLTDHCRPVNPTFKGSVYQVDEKRDHRFHGVIRTPPLFDGSSELTGSLRRVSARVAGGGDPNLAEFGARAPRIADFKALLERESGRALGTAVTLEGTSTHPGLRPGDTISVAAAVNWKPSSLGQYGLVRVVHRFDGEEYRNEFVATPWSGFTNWSPPPRRTIPGCVTAEVVDNRDPRDQGRLRVRYRWQDKDQKTGWVRVVTPHAGHERGMVFLPEVGDEVLLAFEMGDPERPFVLGSMWNGKDAAPPDRDVKRIVTRSGNTVRLVDRDGEEVVEIFTAEGKCLVQLANRVDGTPTLTVHSEGDLSLEAPNGQIRLRCRELVEVVEDDASREAGGSATWKVGRSLTAQAGADVKIAAGASAALVAGANLDAVAGAVNTVVGSLVHINPPGHVKPTVRAQVPQTPVSVWSRQPVPARSSGTSTEDPPTPRTLS